MDEKIITRKSPRLRQHLQQQQEEDGANNEVNDCSIIGSSNGNGSEIIRNSDIGKHVNVGKETEDMDQIIDKLFDNGNNENGNDSKDVSPFSTITKSSWCLRSGLKHIASIDAKQQKNKSLSGRGRQDHSVVTMLDLIQQHGIPNFYSCIAATKRNTCRHDATQDIKDPQSCFESLCRIIIGQMVSGKAAQVIWNRFVERITTHHHTNNNNKTKKVKTSATTISDSTSILSNKSKSLLFTPEQVMSVVRGKSLTAAPIDANAVEENLQKPVGLTKNKAKSIIDLAEHFLDGRLSEEFLYNTANDDNEIRTKLIAVKGIGHWTCEMFLMFNLERPNILPLGDLGVRKGIALYFGNGYYSSTKKDKTSPTRNQKNNNNNEDTAVRSALQCYEPYQSLVSYYMWRLVDTPPPSVSDKDKGTKKKNVAGVSSESSSDDSTVACVSASSDIIVSSLSSPVPLTPNSRIKVVTPLTNNQPSKDIPVKSTRNLNKQFLADNVKDIYQKQDDENRQKRKRN